MNSRRNPEAQALASKKYRATEKGKAAKRRAEEKHKKNHEARRIKSRYGLDASAFQALCEKHPTCAICGRADRPLVIDHDHTSGKVRGRLCNNCNTGIGQFSDSTECMSRAIEYLNSFSKES